MRREWAAHYLDGHTAIRHAATVRLMARGHGGDDLGRLDADLAVSRVRQTQGFYEGEDVRLERGGELAEAIVVTDPAFLASLREAAPDARRFHDPAVRSRRGRLTALAGVAVLGLTAALYFWGVPLLAALAAPRVPVSWEETLGQAVTDQLAPANLVCADPRGQRALDAIVARLAAARHPRRTRSARAW